MKLNHLLLPIRIGGMEVKNRLVMAPMVTNLSSPEGEVTPALIAYFAARARGGVGLIITGDTTVSSAALYHPTMLRLTEDRFLPGWRDLAQAVHAHGARITPQLVHPSFNAPAANSGLQPVAASPIASRRFREMPRELSVPEIEGIIEQFGEAAVRAREAGCDGVHLHCAHMHHLLGSFLSPLYNKRADAYGGSLQGRLRLPLEVIRRVRSRAGPDFPILMRISGDEFMPGGRTLEESLMIAPLLVEAGADALHVSAGTGDNFWVVIPPMGTPLALNAPLSAAVKKVVSVPVICVGRINTPWAAEHVLTGGQADMVALGRPLVADPEFFSKAAEGRGEEIIPCVGDSMCIVNVAMDKPIRCVLNPLTGREETALAPAAAPQNVLVVGGGPAGMAAASAAAVRGHRVTLMEKHSKLGGQLLLACFPPMKQEYACAVQYLARRVAQAGVQVELNREATPEAVKDFGPDIVVVATGAAPLVPEEICGAGAKTLTAWDVLSGKALAGPRVVVIGGGKVGCETADFLAHPVDDLAPRGNRVTLLEMAENIAADELSAARSLLVQRLKAKGVEIITRAKVVKVLPEGVQYVQGGREETIAGVDTIVLAMGTRPENALYEKLKEGPIPVQLIGDAQKPRTALEAIAEGWEAGRRI